ncbi:MAG: hypothetical protein U0M02_08585 [Acutalibacteraceae bacterium]|nr:hypothetical protein [Acutalibacteraceae bacterium]
MRYSKEHCWVEKTADGVKIGITDYLRNRICRNFIINLCDEDDEIRAGEIMGDVESCDFFDIIAPVSGTVLRVNDDVLMNPQLLLDGNVWLAEFTDVSYTKPLMSEDEYEIFLSHK